MITLFYINNKLSFQTENFDSKIIESEDALIDIYDFVMNKYPENNWTDVMCDKIIKSDTKIEIYLTVFEYLN